MKDDLEQFIAKNREQFNTAVPPPQVLGRILERMHPEEKGRPAGILISFRVIRWAAACVAVLALPTVLLLKQKEKETAPVIAKTNRPIKQEVTNAVKPVDPKPVPAALDAIDRDLLRREEAIQAKLKVRDAIPRQQVRLASLSDMESPAGRINATAATEKLPNYGNDVVDALVTTLSTDPNSNVRLAALDGLARFYQENYVRQQLVKALKKQHDPVVQVAMINLLVRMRASGILEQLDKMVKDDNTNKAVKDCAYSGLLELTSI